MTPRALIISRIRKCLALAKSANEHEAAAALAKARALMDDYGVEGDDPALAGVADAIGKGSGTVKPTMWETGLAQVVRRAFACEVLYNHVAGGWRFIGRDPSAEIAAYAFQVLYRQLRRARAEHIAKHLRRCTIARKRVRAQIFCDGWVSAIMDKIFALVPKPDVDAAVSRYVAERFPGIGQLAVRHGKERLSSAEYGDFDRGARLGDAVDLNAGVGGASSRLALA